MTDKLKAIRVLDKIIFGCVILFLVSTNNSIFINQLGYYGALLCILIEYFLGENRFRKTGLEAAFALFILIEIVSAFFSINEHQAFNNVLRRFLLIPTVYTFLAAADDLKKAKLFFKVYLGAALLTVTFYLAFAFKYFIANLYAVEGKGPSLFQYVMTAGGLISFTTIFFFAFFLNEKKGFKMRMFYLAGFLICLVALIASDTRAAWIGAAGAILLMLIVKRKWLILLPMAVLLVAVILVQKNVSLVHVYSSKGKGFVEEKTIPTKGRATSLYSEGPDVYLSDYDNGLLQFRNMAISKRIPTPSPAVKMVYWTDSCYVERLLDERLLLFKKTNGRMNLINEFISPGVLYDFFVSNGRLYLADLDSSLTVLWDAKDLSKRKRFPEEGGINKISVDSLIVALYNNKDHLKIYSLGQDGMPKDKIFDEKIKTNYGYLQALDDRLFFADDKSLKLFKIDNGSVTLTDSSRELQGAWSYYLFGRRLLASDYKGNIYEMDYPLQDKISYSVIKHLNYSPSSITSSNGKLLISEVKRSRIGTIVDPYHPTNIERMNLWRAGFKAWKDHPVFGVGDIDMQPVYKTYRDYFDKLTYGHFHNNYVHFLAALGIPGFIVVMFMIVSILLTHIKIYKSLKAVEFASSYSLGAMAAFAGFLISGLAEWNFGDHEIITMVWFTLGLNLAFYFASSKKVEKTEVVAPEEKALNLKQI